MTIIIPSGTRVQYAVAPPTIIDWISNRSDKNGYFFKDDFCFSFDDLHKQLVYYPNLKPKGTELPEGTIIDIEY